MDNVEVSLVICTRNRATQLKDCLRYVAQMNPSCSWELVIVDNGSSDETAAILAEYAANALFPVKILQENTAGLGRAQNTGWKAASGENIAFTDDDCYVAFDYIDRVREAFSDAKVGFGGGRVDLFDPTDIPMTIRTSDKRELFKPQSFIEGGVFLGANMIYRRRVLEEIGGFDPDLGPGGRFYGEEMDAQTRASFAGWWGLYAPEVVVAHHHGRKEKEAAGLQRIYSIGNGAYMAKLLLVSETRPIVLRNLYWKARKAVRRSAERRWLMWEMQGITGYLAYRLRKRVSNK